MRRFLLLACLIGLSGARVLATDTLPNVPLLPPVVYKDTVIFSQRTTDKIIAVKRKTGAIVWIWSAGREMSIRSQPCIKGATVFIGYGKHCTDGNIAAIDCKTGKLKWKLSALPSINSLTIINDMLLCHTDGYLLYLVPESGMLQWNLIGYDLKGVFGNKLLLESATDKTLHLADSGTGVVERALELPVSLDDRVSTNPDGIAVFKTKDGLCAVDLQKEAVLWKKKLDFSRISFRPTKAACYVFRAIGEEDGGHLERRSIKTGDILASVKFSGCHHPGRDFPVLTESYCVSRIGRHVIGFTKDDLKEVWRWDFGKEAVRSGALFGSYMKHWHEPSAILNLHMSQSVKLDKGADRLFLAGGGHQLDPRFMFEVDLNKGQLSWSYWVKEIGHHSEGMIFVDVPGHRGFLDSQFKEAFELELKCRPSDYHEGLVAIREYDGVTRTKYLDVNGKVELEVNGRAGDFHEGLATINTYNNQTGKTMWGYINKKAKVVIPLEYYEAGRFSEGLAAVCTQSIPSRGGNIERWGYINASGKLVIKPEFNYAGSFKNAQAEVNKGGFNEMTSAGPMLYGGEWYKIDKQGKRIKN